MLLITQTRRTIGIGSRDAIAAERVAPTPPVTLPRVKTTDQSQYQFRPDDKGPEKLYRWAR